MEAKISKCGENSSHFSEIKLTLLGDPAASYQDILVLFHGDTPRYYETPISNKNTPPTLEADLTKLNRYLLGSQRSLLVVQPVCARRNWYSLYSSSPSDTRAAKICHEFNSLIKRLLNDETRLHLHSFSGAGRLDRALHEFVTTTEGAALSKAICTWSASDAMVNNSFSSGQKRGTNSVMALSWMNYIKDHPDVTVTFIYDRSGQYPHMQIVHLEVYQLLNNKKTAIDPKEVGKKLSEIVTHESAPALLSGPNHINTFLGFVARVYIDNERKRSTKEPS